MEIPIKQRNALLKIKRALKDPSNKSFFIAGHLNPDGDTVGGTLALYSLLLRLKKKAVFPYNRHSVPAIYRFLNNSGKIITADRVEGNFDVAIIIDCADPARTGGIIDVSKQARTVIKIDHHADDRRWAGINFAGPEYSSVTEMIFYVFREMGVRPTREEAECLYTGIVTDTRNFVQPNTTPRSHYVAAGLLGLGADPVKVEKNVYGTKPVSALLLLGKTLENIKVSGSGEIAYSVITKGIFKKTGAAYEDAESIINYVGMVPGVLVWVLFKEIPGEKGLKAGFRSVERIDVNRFAKLFGGGGHKNAAGCTLNMPLDEAVKKVLGSLNKYLK